MTISLACPRCTHTQSVDDDKAGKQIHCKICHHLVPVPKAGKTAPTKPPAAAAKPVAAPAPAKEKDADGEKVQAGPPAPAPTRNGKGAKADPDEAKPKRRAAPSSRDDDEDDDSPPRRKTRRQNQGSSATVWIVAGIGVFALLGILLLGVVLCVVFLRGGDDNPPIAGGPAPGDPLPPGGVVLPPGVPGIPNNPAPDRLDPNNPADFDRAFAALKNRQEGPAYDWFRQANPEHPRRAEVAKALEQQLDRHLKPVFPNDAYFAAYFRWATKDNVAGLMRMADDATFTVWHNRRRHDSIRLLGQLKESKAVPILVKKLGGGDSAVARDALRAIGKAAEPELLICLNHPNDNARREGRTLLRTLNTMPDALLKQSLADLKSNEDRRKALAVEWFSQNVPPAGADRTAAAKALNAYMATKAGLSEQLAQALRRWGDAENVPNLLIYVNDPDGRTRHAARDILKANGAKADMLLRQTIKDLASVDERVRNCAVEWLAQNPPEADAKEREQVARALDEQIINERSLHGNMGKALEHWATADSVPKLAKILDESRLGNRGVILIIGKFKTKQAYEALARRVGNFFDGNDARQALLAAGKDAEEAVAAQLTSPDGRTRIEACRLLGSIGTVRSAKAIQAAAALHARDRQFQVIAMAAFNACRARK